MGFVDPPNGSVIVDFEGTLKVTTITCNIVNNSRIQDRTVWSISNFRGVSSFCVFGDDIAPEMFLFSGDPIPGAPPTQTYQNRLTVLVLSPDLDHVMVACGNSTLPVQAYFVFRIYCKSNIYPLFFMQTVKLMCLHTYIGIPNLRKHLIVRLQDLRVTLAVFFWMSCVSITMTYILFSLIVTRCMIFSESDLPSFVTQGPTHQYILLGDSLSLVYGTGLDSNPQATITWTAPDGTTIMDNARYELDNGHDIELHEHNFE